MFFPSIFCLSSSSVLWLLRVYPSSLSGWPCKYKQLSRQASLSIRSSLLSLHTHTHTHTERERVRESSLQPYALFFLLLLLLLLLPPDKAAEVT